MDATKLPTKQIHGERLQANSISNLNVNSRTPHYDAQQNFVTQGLQARICNARACVDVWVSLDSM
jgi:hypothetical protein